MNYYWVEWGGAWGLWVNQPNGRRCVIRMHLDEKGWWRVKWVDGIAVNERRYFGRYKSLDRAKAAVVIKVRFPDEGEMK